MLADFTEGLRDARRAPRRWHLVGWLARVAWDLMWAISRQWLRTAVPWLTAAYAAAILGVCESLSAIMLGSRTVGPDVTTLVAVAFALSVLIFALWFILPNVRRPTPVSIRA